MYSTCLDHMFDDVVGIRARSETLPSHPTRLASYGAPHSDCFVLYARIYGKIKHRNDNIGLDLTVIRQYDRPPFPASARKTIRSQFWRLDVSQQGANTKIICWGR